MILDQKHQRFQKLCRQFAETEFTKELLDKLSGGVFKTISINSLFDVPDKPIKISGYKNCYGASNEVETILGRA